MTNLVAGAVGHNEPEWLEGSLPQNVAQFLGRHGLILGSICACIILEAAMAAKVSSREAAPCPAAPGDFRPQPHER